MNRTKKSCVYRDCTTTNLHTDLTLFQFPKNEERAAKWCELGAVNPLEERPRYMCELHFPRIYMCFSARRKMLLNMAVPRAFGADEDEDDQDQQQVQSSSYETEEVAIEEHLDESLIDEGDELATEIIYLNPQTLEREQDKPTTSGERPEPVETAPPAKIIKLEKLPATSRSMVVSSSSTKSADDSRKPTTFTAPHGTILRRIKLKKKSPASSATKTILVKTIKPSSIMQEVPVATEVTVSSSPERKASASESDPKKEEEQNERASSAKLTSAVASSSNGTAVEATNVTPGPTEKEEQEKKPRAEDKSPQKKDDTVYEFIFKGEEYIQMPKAKYDGERKQLEKQLEQSAKAQEQMEKKIAYYRRSLRDLKEFLHNVCEENVDYDD